MDILGFFDPAYKKSSINNNIDENNNNSESTASSCVGRLRDAVKAVRQSFKTWELFKTCNVDGKILFPILDVITR